MNIDPVKIIYSSGTFHNANRTVQERNLNSS